jgi:quinol monooxygenase YgiN
MSNQHVQLDPVFAVQDWDALLPLVKDGYDKIRANEPHTHSYAFAVESGGGGGGGDDVDTKYLAVNEVYPNGEAVVEHLQNVGEILGRALDGPCKVHKFYASGPAAELGKIKPLLDPLGPVTYFETIHLEGDKEKDGIAGGVSHVAKIRDMADHKDDASPHADVVESFAILPVFKVHDWDKVQTAFMEPLLEVASSETGCVYFSFARNTEEGLLLVRERYADVDAALQHLEKAAPILASCLAEGLLELVEASVYGSSGAIEAGRPAFDPFGTKYRTILHAFDRLLVE